MDLGIVAVLDEHLFRGINLFYFALDIWERIKMPNPLDRWLQENEAEHAHYAILAGFEADLRQDDNLAELYDEMSILGKLALFGFVVTLLEEAKE